jgi:hypothetical protein
MIRLLVLPKATFGILIATTVPSLLTKETTVEEHQALNPRPNLGVVRVLGQVVPIGSVMGWRV